MVRRGELPGPGQRHIYRACFQCHGKAHTLGGLIGGGLFDHKSSGDLGE